MIIRCRMSGSTSSVPQVLAAAAAVRAIFPRGWRLRPLLGAGVMAVAVTWPLASQAGVITSGQDRTLAIRAYGNRVSLQIGCATGIEGCGWTFRGGQLIEEASGHALRPAGEAAAGAVLVLGPCDAQDHGCRWIYSGGQFRNMLNRTLTMAIQGSARRGSELIMRSDCRPGLPECSWQIR